MCQICLVLFFSGLYGTNQNRLVNSPKPQSKNELIKLTRANYKKIENKM